MNTLKLMMPVETPQDAAMAQDAGLERVFYDMEYIGNLDRHYGRNAAFACRPIEMIPEVKKELTTTELVVRINTDRAYSEMEIEKAIKYGADVLMMPMVLDQHQVEDFVKRVNGRAKVCVMIETGAALSRLTRILAVKGVDEIYVGINDLHLSMGLAFVFEPLRDGLIDYIADKCHAVGIPFGFGSIARIGNGLVPSELILGEHVRLKSTSTLLAHTFFYPEKESSIARPFTLNNEIQLVREEICRLNQLESIALDENHRKVVAILDKIVDSKI